MGPKYRDLGELGIGEDGRDYSGFLHRFLQNVQLLYKIDICAGGFTDNGASSIRSIYLFNTSQTSPSYKNKYLSQIKNLMFSMYRKHILENTHF